MPITHSTLADATFSAEGQAAWDAEHTFSDIILTVNSNIPDINGDVTLNASDVGAEATLGNPDVDGKVLSSLANGTRSWVAKVSTTGDETITGIKTFSGGTLGPVIFNVQSDSYTVATSDNGKIIVMTKATASNLTLPSDLTGFSEGFQCQVWNQSANNVDVSLAGTVTASGTKVAQKKSAYIVLRNSTWYAAGGLS